MAEDDRWLKHAAIAFASTTIGGTLALFIVMSIPWASLFNTPSADTTKPPRITPTLISVEAARIPAEKIQPPGAITASLSARVNKVGNGIVVASIPISTWLEAQAAGPKHRLILRDLPDGAFLLVGERTADNSWFVDPTGLSEVGLMFASRPIGDVSITIELHADADQPPAVERAQIAFSSLPAETLVPSAVATSKLATPSMPEVAIVNRAPEFSKPLQARTASSSVTSVSTTISTVDVGGLPARVSMISSEPPTAGKPIGSPSYLGAPETLPPVAEISPSTLAPVVRKLVKKRGAVEDGIDEPRPRAVRARRAPEPGRTTADPVKPLTTWSDRVFGPDRN